MGKSGSGKTSMRSIIFANYIARDTRRLGATIEVEHSHVRFLGNLVLNLFDCGGQVRKINSYPLQEAFMENYLASQRDHIFRNVEVLIYVFDVGSREYDKDMKYYRSSLDAILEHSKDAKIFCLIHKMDLIQDELRDGVFDERRVDLVKRSEPLDVSCFKTSIWDETLYKVFSSFAFISTLPSSFDCSTFKTFFIFWPMYLQYFSHAWAWCKIDICILLSWLYRYVWVIVSHRCG